MRACFGWGRVGVGGQGRLGLGQRVGRSQPERMRKHRRHTFRAHLGGNVVRVGVEVAAQKHAVGPRRAPRLQRIQQLRNLHEVVW